jgi:hypothetical protein
MGIGPNRPIHDLEGAIERGDLDMAVAIAKDLAREHGRPIGLDLAFQVLPLIAAQRLDQYDRWACRWLGRWLAETSAATIDQAAEIAGALAELPLEPVAATDAIRRARAG